MFSFANINLLKMSKKFILDMNNIEKLLKNGKKNFYE